MFCFEIIKLRTKSIKFKTVLRFTSFEKNNLAGSEKAFHLFIENKK